MGRPVSPLPSMRNLGLCAQSVTQCSVHDRIGLASAHGFRYTSILGPEHRTLAAEGVGGLPLRGYLDDHGVAIAEVDALVDWLPGTERVPWVASLPGLSELLEIADTLGAYALNVVDLLEGPVPPLDVAAEAFAAVCDQAAPQGVVVALEFVPWTRIPDLATAVEIVDRAGRANGGVMFDSWHHHRGGGTIDDLDDHAISRIVALQINDAPASEFGARVRQPEQRRLLPGDGVIGVGALLRRLHDGGCRAPLGLEVISVDLAQEPVDEVVARLAAAIRSVFPFEETAG